MIPQPVCRGDAAEKAVVGNHLTLSEEVLGGPGQGQGPDPVLGVTKRIAALLSVIESDAPTAKAACTLPDTRSIKHRLSCFKQPITISPAFTAG